MMYTKGTPSFAMKTMMIYYPHLLGRLGACHPLPKDLLISIDECWLTQRL
jgi:hypothetical protein